MRISSLILLLLVLFLSRPETTTFSYLSEPGLSI